MDYSLILRMVELNTIEEISLFSATSLLSAILLFVSLLSGVLFVVSSFSSDSYTLPPTFMAIMYVSGMLSFLIDPSVYSSEQTEVKYEYNVSTYEFASMCIENNLEPARVTSEIQERYELVENINLEEVYFTYDKLKEGTKE